MKKLELEFSDKTAKRLEEMRQELGCETLVDVITIAVRFTSSLMRSENFERALIFRNEQGGRVRSD